METQETKIASRAEEMQKLKLLTTARDLALEELGKSFIGNEARRNQLKSAIAKLDADINECGLNMPSI